MNKATILALWRDMPTRTVAIAVGSLTANLAYAFYHGILGILTRSTWLTANGIYYFLLTVARFVAVLHARKPHSERRLCAAVGGLLFTLSALLGGLLYYSLRQNIATVYGSIPMITIATVTFTKITLTAVSAARQRGKLSLCLRTINALRYAEIAVSLCTMQRSMLVSFGDAPQGAFALNLFTGIGVCLFVVFLGVYLFHISRKEATSHGEISHCESQ